MSGMCLFKSMQQKQTNTFIVKYRTNREDKIKIFLEDSIVLTQMCRNEFLQGSMPV